MAVHDVVHCDSVGFPEMKGPLNHPDWTILYHLSIDTHGDLGSLNFTNPPSNPHVSLTVESLDRLATLNSSARVWSNSACIGPQHLAAGKNSLSGTWGKIHRPMWWWHIHGQCMQILWTNKCQILYFEWSPQWLSQFLTVHLEVYGTYIFWHPIQAFYLAVCSVILLWHSIWHLFWHPIRHSFWHSFWHLFQHSFFGIYSGILSCIYSDILSDMTLLDLNRKRQISVGSGDLALAVEVRQWALELAAEVRQCPSTSGTRSWGPDGWMDGRKDEEALEVILIKSGGTHLAGGEKITHKTMLNIHGLLTDIPGIMHVDILAFEPWRLFCNLASACKHGISIWSTCKNDIRCRPLSHHVPSPPPACMPCPVVRLSCLPRSGKNHVMLSSYSHIDMCRNHSKNTRYTGIQGKLKRTWGKGESTKASRAVVGLHCPLGPASEKPPM